MDKPTPQRLARFQLESFLGTNPELIRAFEAYIKWLAELTPDEITALEINVSAAQAAINDLASSIARAEADNQAALVAALSGQIEQLREQLAAIPDQQQELLNLRADIANLRESTQMGQRIRRIEQQTINISSANLSNTYNITGLIGPYELRYLGANSDDVNCDGANVSLTRSGSVVTATRNATGFNTRVSFEFTEYYP